MENDEEEDDEEKMTKFFALLRRTREVRNQIMSSVNKSQEGGKREGEEEKPAMQVWNPSFRPEDFMEGADHHQSDKAGPQASLAGTSKREPETKEGDKEGGNDGLDLKLSL
ncbi:protein NIM1-INTERACTING 1-like [Actinidia eriantha]|uniref:protein NIM1-INTERACTING 1-like n=1 Tax=Actinidia eriantha TaxID=165200 RepID=UPI0025861E1B|nr:protein NIM1-INTERACTING 1-like [Actinidia eriantha]